MRTVAAILLTNVCLLTTGCATTAHEHSQITPTLVLPAEEMSEIVSSALQPGHWSYDRNDYYLATNPRPPAVDFEVAEIAIDDDQFTFDGEPFDYYRQRTDIYERRFSR